MKVISTGVKIAFLMLQVCFFLSDIKKKKESKQSRIKIVFLRRLAVMLCHFTVSDKPTEEDASHWSYNPRCQKDWKSRVCEILQNCL